MTVAFVWTEGDTCSNDGSCSGSGEAERWGRNRGVVQGDTKNPAGCRQRVQEQVWVRSAGGEGRTALIHLQAETSLLNSFQAKSPQLGTMESLIQ